MNYARVKSYAKINLTLDVTGRSGGFHLLDSVLASIDLYDVVSVKERRDSLVSITMRGLGSEGIAFEENNAVKAAEKFIERFGCKGVDVAVSKNIPMCSGLGGSSADAAGVINAMAKLYGVDDFEALSELAADVGSDCPYMLRGGFARFFKRGERVERINSDLKLYIGLLLPKEGVSTAECFNEFDRQNYTPTKTSEEAAKALNVGDARALGKSLTNSLYEPAVRLCADVERAFDYLKSFDPLGVNMTGSGSCVYALFENDQFLQYAMSRNRSGLKFIPARTVIPAIK